MPTICVLSRNMKKYQNHYLKIFSVLVVKFSVYLNRHVFVMDAIAGNKNKFYSDRAMQQRVFAQPD